MNLLVKKIIDETFEKPDFKDINLPLLRVKRIIDELYNKLVSNVTSLTVSQKTISDSQESLEWLSLPENSNSTLNYILLGGKND